jgi:thioester reductase-like protein
MAYLLLTGATGLLGGYLLRDALRQNLPVVVIARRSATLSACRRIDGVLAPWERDRALPRPVVLEGDLSQPNLGLSSTDLGWLADNCDTVVHSAASISFYREEKTGEPYRSNVDGTRHLLDLCRAAGIHDFHHVSTAYVCGQRSGRVLEAELDAGQQHGNDYERSKVAAEQMVQAAGFDKAPTIYRPSIIVGDSVSGYTTTYHGFYTPLQLAWLLAKSGAIDSGVDDLFLRQLGLTGSERKNIVPVDWVSQAILHLLQNQEAHGRTYHLTCPQPPSAAEITLAIGDAVRAKLSGSDTASAPAAGQLPSGAASSATSDIEAEFRRHMDVYRAYFRDHPEFDTANLQAAAPHLPCPAVDRTLLARTGQYALDANFGWPRVQPPAPPFNIDALLADLPRARRNGTSLLCALEVTGCGGGNWTFDFAGAAPALLQRGRADEVQATLRLRGDTLAALEQRRCTVHEAIAHGRLVVAAPPVLAKAAGQFLQTLLQGRPESSPTQKQYGHPSVHSGPAGIT